MRLRIHSFRSSFVSISDPDPGILSYCGSRLTNSDEKINYCETEKTYLQKCLHSVLPWKFFPVNNKPCVLWTNYDWPDWSMMTCIAGLVCWALCPAGLSQIQRHSGIYIRYLPRHPWYCFYGWSHFSPNKFFSEMVNRMMMYSKIIIHYISVTTEKHITETHQNC